MRRKKNKGEEYIPEHEREEKELKRREKKEIDIDVFYIWGRKRRTKESCLL